MHKALLKSAQNCKGSQRSRLNKRLEKMSNEFKLLKSAQNCKGSQRSRLNKRLEKMSNEFRFSKVLELFGVEKITGKKLKALLFSNQFEIDEYENFAPKYLKKLGYKVPDTYQELNPEDC